MRPTALARLIVLLAPVCVGSGCEDTSYREIGSEIGVLTKRDDAFVAPAARRLAAFGNRAIPQIETAMHTASPTGKRHLVAALEGIGTPEVVPVLRHFALYDPSDDVRRVCEVLLQRWSGDRSRRDVAARAALAWVAERRKTGDGPVVLDEP